MTSKWRQKSARCALLNRWPRKPGDKVVLFWWEEKQRAKWRNSFKNGEIFWMNEKAIIEFGFRRIWRVLQISEGVIHLGLWMTPSFICIILHILRKPNSIIAKYVQIFHVREVSKSCVWYKAYHIVLQQSIEQSRNRRMKIINLIITSFPGLFAYIRETFRRDWIFMDTQLLHHFSRLYFETSTAH